MLPLSPPPFAGVSPLWVTPASLTPCPLPPAVHTSSFFPSRRIRSCPQSPPFLSPPSPLQVPFKSRSSRLGIPRPSGVQLKGKGFGGPGKSSWAAHGGGGWQLSGNDTLSMAGPPPGGRWGKVRPKFWRWGLNIMRCCIAFGAVWWDPPPSGS